MSTLRRSAKQTKRNDIIFMGATYACYTDITLHLGFSQYMLELTVMRHSIYITSSLIKDMACSRTCYRNFADEKCRSIFLCRRCNLDHVVGCAIAHWRDYNKVRAVWRVINFIQYYKEFDEKYVDILYLGYNNS